MSKKLFWKLCEKLEAVQGLFYIIKLNSAGEKVAVPAFGYALTNQNSLSKEFESGDGLIGMVLKEEKELILNELPNEYFQVQSGLGSTKKINLAIFPFHSGKRVIAIIELALFKKIDDELIKEIIPFESELQVILAKEIEGAYEK